MNVKVYLLGARNWLSADSDENEPDEANRLLGGLRSN